MVFACLQTKKGKKARRTTTAEFEMLMQVMQMYARVKLFQSHGLNALFSWDNAGHQSVADLASMRLCSWEHVPLAAYMPDGHKVIEHTFNRLKGALWNSIAEEGPITTGAEAQDRIERLFFEMPPEHFLRDAGDLPLTYQYIATDAGVHFTGPENLDHVGVGGDWAPTTHQ